MINELKDLMEAVAHLPQYVMWCLVGFLFYKLFVIGNVYAIIRLGIHKLYDYATREEITQLVFKSFTLSETTSSDLERLLTAVINEKENDRIRITAQMNSQRDENARLRNVQHSLSNAVYFGSYRYFSHTEMSELNEAWAFYLKHKNEQIAQKAASAKL